MTGHRLLSLSPRDIRENVLTSTSQIYSRESQCYSSWSVNSGTWNILPYKYLWKLGQRSRYITLSNPNLIWLEVSSTCWWPKIQFRNAESQRQNERMICRNADLLELFTRRKRLFVKKDYRRFELERSVELAVAITFRSQIQRGQRCYRDLDHNTRANHFVKRFSRSYP